MGSEIKEGTIDVSTTLYVIDEVTGLPDLTLTFTDFALWYRREVDPGSTPLVVQNGFTEVSQTVTGAHVDYGVVHLEGGVYRVDYPDAAYAAGAIGVTLGAAVTGKIVLPNYQEIVGYDPKDGAGLGLTDIAALKQGIIFGAAATGTLSTTQATTDLTGYSDDQLIDAIIVVTSGGAEGDRKTITDYASTSGLITFDAMTVAMANTDTFKIV